MAGFWDIHCHILHGVDDGPSDIETVVQLTLELESIGFSNLIPTPHQKYGIYTPSHEQITCARQQLQEALMQFPKYPTIHSAGAEYMWNEELLRVENSDFFSYPGGHAFLVAFNPDYIPPMLEERIFDFQLRGKLPVLAHIEQYIPLCRNLDRLNSISQRAALMVNLSSLGGMAGWSISRLARKLIDKHLIHAVATDIHTLLEINYCRKGINWIRKNYGGNHLHKLLIENPQSILYGEIPSW